MKQANRTRREIQRCKSSLEQYFIGVAVHTAVPEPDSFVKMTTDYVGSMNSHKIVTTWTSKYSFYTYKRKTINPWMGIIIIHTVNKSVNFTLVGKDVPKYCNNICFPYLIFQINWILSFFSFFWCFFSKPMHYLLYYQHITWLYIPRTAFKGEAFLQWLSKDLN